jgi:hypothetical protein
LQYGHGRKDNSPALDRKSNQKILNIDNVQILSDKCNATKHNRTMKEFIEYCKIVYFKFCD